MTMDKQPTPGTVLVDYERLRHELESRALSESTFCVQAGISPKTMANIRKGVGIRPSSLAAIAGFLKLAPSELLLKSPMTSKNGSLYEWDLVEPLNGVRKADNGVEFQVWRLRHKSLRDSWGRGKHYHLDRLASRDKLRIREVFLRHPIVCRRFRGDPHIAMNLSVFPEQEDRSWWAIDEWIEGQSLAQRLQTGPLLRDDLPRVMRQIALGLRSLHQAVIVRRDLAPENVMIRTSDRAVVLTEFEMSKLFDGSPTVANDWSNAAYRAPEIGSPTLPAVSADLYSWARVFVHAATGELPDPSHEDKALKDVALPTPVREIVRKCLAISPMKRPLHIDAVIESLGDWQQ